MRTKLLWIVVIVGFLAGGYAFTSHAIAGGGKNLKVLPKSMSKKQVKKVMKAYSKALGVDCEFCHDVDNFASDSNKHKKIARKMMIMTRDINKKHLKGAKRKVTCNTCHRGKKHPK